MNRERDQVGGDDADHNLDHLVTELGLNSDGTRREPVTLDGEVVRNDRHESEPPSEPHADDTDHRPQGDEVSYETVGQQASDRVAHGGNALSLFLAELPLALRGKSDKVSKGRAIAVLAGAILVPAVAIAVLSPKGKEAPSVESAQATQSRLSANTPAGHPAATQQATNAPAPRVAAASTAPPVVSSNVKSGDTPVNQAGAAAWKSTNDGLNAKVEDILTSGQQTQTASASPAPAAQPGPTVIRPTLGGISNPVADQVGQAQIAKMVGDLKTDLDQVKKNQADEAGALTDVSNRVSYVEGEMKAVTTQLANTQGMVEASQKEAAQNTRPALVVENITLGSGCETCSAVATVSYQGSQQTLSDGDTFLGYTVRLDGNRVVLTKGTAVYSYIPEESAP